MSRTRRPASACSCSWPSRCCGSGCCWELSPRSADAVTGIVFIVIFPLTFVANAFVPAGTLPGVLRTAANWNPISSLVAALRTLFGNPTAIPADAPWPLQHPVASALLWCTAILAVVVPLAIAAYRRRTEA